MCYVAIVEILESLAHLKGNRLTMVFFQYVPSLEDGLKVSVRNKLHQYVEVFRGLVVFNVLYNIGLLYFSISWNIPR